MPAAGADDRERFEAWARVNFSDISRWKQNKNHYHNNDVELTWTAWQAALSAAREKEQPVAWQVDYRSGRVEVCTSEENMLEVKHEIDAGHLRASLTPLYAHPPTASPPQEKQVEPTNLLEAYEMHKTALEKMLAQQQECIRLVRIRDQFGQQAINEHRESNHG